MDHYTLHCGQREVLQGPRRASGWLRITRPQQWHPRNKHGDRQRVTPKPASREASSQCSSPAAWRWASCLTSYSAPRGRGWVALRCPPDHLTGVQNASSPETTRAGLRSCTRWARGAHAGAAGTRSKRRGAVPRAAAGWGPPAPVAPPAARHATKVGSGPNGATAAPPHTHTASRWPTRRTRLRRREPTRPRRAEMSHGSQRGGPALTTAALRAPAGQSSSAVLPQHGRAVPTAPRQDSGTRTVPRPHRTVPPSCGWARPGGWAAPSPRRLRPRPPRRRSRGGSRQPAAPAPAAPACPVARPRTADAPAPRERSPPRGPPCCATPAGTATRAAPAPRRAYSARRRRGRRPARPCCAGTREDPSDPAPRGCRHRRPRQLIKRRPRPGRAPLAPHQAHFHGAAAKRAPIGWRRRPDRAIGRPPRGAAYLGGGRRRRVPRSPGGVAPGCARRAAGARSELKLGPGRRLRAGRWGCSGSPALGLRVPRARPRRHRIDGRASTFEGSACLVTPPARVPRWGREARAAGGTTQFAVRTWGCSPAVEDSLRAVTTCAHWPVGQCFGQLPACGRR